MIMSILGSFQKPERNFGISGHMSYKAGTKVAPPKPHILAIPSDSTLCVHAEIHDGGVIERCKEKADTSGKHGFLCLGHLNKH